MVRDYLIRSRNLKMTRMHYEAIATVLRDSKPDTGNKYAPRTIQTKGAGAALQWRATVERFANMCTATNPRFDRSRFYKACGYEEV